MPRPRKAFLEARCHKGAAVVDLYLNGVRRTVTLGPWGSDQARLELARLQAEHGASPAPHAGPGLTVNEVLLAFLDFAVRHYRRADGTTTDEVGQYKQTFRLVRGLYGHTPAREFGPLALKAVRQAMIDAGWCRKLVNQRVGRVKRVFKWAASEELLPAGVFQALATVTGLQRGRTAARETVPVEPVAEECVRATLPHLRPEARGLVEVQLLTGMRPGEVCRLRPCDIDTAGPVWLYRPAQHKTAHRGKKKVVAIGPRTQAVLTRFEPTSPTNCYFSPRRAVGQLHADRTANRKTPRYPSHMRRNAGQRVAEAKRAPAERYDVTGYGHAVVRACDKAFPPPGDLAQQPGETRAAWRGRLSADQHEELAAWRKAHRWHPNQLRQAHATEVRGRYGLEAAGAALGHDQLSTTEIYAEKNRALAVKVAAELG